MDSKCILVGFLLINSQIACDLNKHIGQLNGKRYLLSVNRIGAMLKYTSGGWWAAVSICRVGIFLMSFKFWK